ncbi:MAG: rRNA maturation RNase YbeY, partial [Desulfovibrionales bacterium]
MARNEKSSDANPPDRHQVLVTGPGTLNPLLPVARRELATLAERILDVFAFQAARVEIRLMHDREMARLNAAYFGVHAPTNVLSFPEDETLSAESTDLGLIALSLETLHRETVLYGQKPVEHLIRLLAHALLHLAGLEHGSEMERLTEQALLLARPSDSLP